MISSETVGSNPWSPPPTLLKPSKSGQAPMGTDRVEHNPTVIEVCGHVMSGLAWGHEGREED